jgi:hypothetical protein
MLGYYSKFEIKDLYAAKKNARFEITGEKNSGLLFLSQHSYINQILHCFNMLNAKSNTTSIAPHFK